LTALAEEIFRPTLLLQKSELRLVSLAFIASVQEVPGLLRNTLKMTR
jgi:hypothetical protein